MEEQKLYRVWTAGNGEYAVEDGRVTSIVLKRDGHGPMGYYDRIHIELSDQPPITLVAHHCPGWQLDSGEA